VLHVAYLARLGLTDDEVARFAPQLSCVLDHFQQLQRLDTEAIPPTAQVTALSNVFAPDVVRPSMGVEDVLLNAPRREENYFRVPAVLEE
jgi:aspartyl-tRNA(Asn)/glutamyl-tRNA(Gln) amidotransferase subunit C